MKTYKYLVLLAQMVFTLVFGVFLTASAENNPQQIFDQANKAFLSNDMESAIKGYEQLVKNGDESAEIYYNLGNAYYKKGAFPKAVLNYERARKLNPSDEDIDFNLRMVNMKLTDKTEQVPGIFYEEWWKKTVDMFPADKWAGFAVSLLWISLFAAVVFLLSRSVLIKRVAFYTGLIIVLFSGLSFYIAGCAHDVCRNSNEAIVFAQSVYIKSSPTEKSTDLFILHEGIKVQVLDQVGEWKKIRLANGNIGWLKQDTIELI